MQKDRLNNTIYNMIIKFKRLNRSAWDRMDVIKDKMKDLEDR